MTIQQFIEAAIKGGWCNNYLNPKSVAEMQYLLAEHKYMMFLDPKAWKAVGEVKGWNSNEKKVVHVSPWLYEEWQGKMIGMTHFLLLGKTLEEYIATL